MSARHRTLKHFNEPGQARFLTFSCFHGLQLLSRDRTRRWMTEAIDRARERHEFQLWGYVIMPEHVHVLILPRHERPEIGPVLSTMKQSVAKRALYWAGKHAPSFFGALADIAPNGTVSHRFWQRGSGYDRNLWSPRDIWEKIDYIHKNPMRRGLCEHPEDWYWSSYRAYRGLDAPLRVDRDQLPPRPS